MFCALAMKKKEHLEVFRQSSSCHRFCYCNLEIPKCNHQPYVHCNFPLQNERRASQAGNENIENYELENVMKSETINEQDCFLIFSKDY